MMADPPSGPEHWRPVPHRNGRVHDHEPESVLGPVDPEEMALAAEELRARTMTLEEARFLPPLRFVVITLAIVFAIAALLVLYRGELRLFLRLHGL